MVRLRLVLALVAAAFVSSAAFAFQEQQATTPRQKDESPVSAPALALDQPPAAKGTAVRIPGLGTLGVIPKMDFGLELLYGATDTSAKRADPSKTDPDDVLVGGRIKHKF
jgi:hypothetical protein